MSAGLAALRAFARGQRPIDAGACELCSAAIGDDHEHLVDPAMRALRCACAACGTAPPSGTRWKRVPRRAAFLAGFQLTDEMWRALEVPVAMAFFVKSSVDARVVASYPSPAGATEALPPAGAWDALVAANPDLASLEPDVEALLVNRSEGARDHYRVSIDRCYALAGLVRAHWRGFTGGPELREETERYFAALRCSA